ncbi:hypothetical protein C8Q77DRAFT_1095102 [Trametes polyzona]|nr:hypothetical protein C8Q77DRAFT_1095102 [Trametes polyzona]
MAATRTAARRAGRELLQERPTTKQHIKLSGLPRTALPDDLRRLCGKTKAENVAGVAIDYRRFRPTGHGYLSFTTPELAEAANKALRRAVAGGKMIETQLIHYLPTIPRARGQKGILEAAERGAVTGDGPGGGVTAGGRNVVMYGLPGRLGADQLIGSLRNFKLAGAEHGREVAVKLEQGERVTSTSRWLVRMASVSEAHRLVRKLHMQFWRPDLIGEKCRIRAFVVW